MDGWAAGFTSGTNARKRTGNLDPSPTHHFRW